MEHDRSIIVIVRRTGPEMFDTELEIDSGDIDAWATRAYLQAAADLLTDLLDGFYGNEDDD